MRDSSTASLAPRPAASVILVRSRPNTGELEMFLQRRHSRASFMSSAFVFPGGTADANETDPRVTAARELFEEAGVLLVREPVPPASLDRWRQGLNAGTCTMAEILAEAGNLTLDLDALHYFAHWITPSVERKRFSARFFLARLPAGQTASADNKEMVASVWVTPAEALVRAGDLRLPPPQIRTFLDLRPTAEQGMEAVLAAAAERAAQPHPILPRPAAGASAVTLLLPWDPEYRTAGTGEAIDMPADHPLATGPSRFVLEDMTWKHINAPSSPDAA